MRVRTTELIVGVFMLAGLAALIFLALQVSGVSGESVKSTYKVYARFENVGGIKPRAKVTIAGVMIGKVSNVTFDKDNFQAIVEMDIFDEVDNLTTDTTAAILTAGLLGEKYIGLSPGADEEFLQDGSEIEDTQSAIVLEELIGQFVFNAGNKKEE